MKSTFLVAGLLAGAATAAIGLAQPAAAGSPAQAMQQILLANAQPPVLARNVVSLMLAEQGYTGVTTLTRDRGVFFAEAYKDADGPYALIIDGRTGVVVAVADER